MSIAFLISTQGLLQYSKLKRSPARAGQAGGEYKLTYLHSKAGTFSLAEGLMD